jgi:hypothetical protein
MTYQSLGKAQLCPHTLKRAMLPSMPTRPLWLERLPEITRQLDSPDFPPLLDRPCIELLFGVKRRQAIRLLAALGGYQSGKTFLIRRDELARQLTELAKTRTAQLARQRKERMVEAMANAQRDLAVRLTEIETAPDVGSRQPQQLPASIRLAGPGTLEIRFSDAEDLLAQVVELASAAGNDFPAFRKIVEGQR